MGLIQVRGKGVAAVEWLFVCCFGWLVFRGFKVFLHKSNGAMKNKAELWLLTSLPSV